jgi:hypothetical protein
MPTLPGDGPKPMLRMLRMYSPVLAMCLCMQTARFFGSVGCRLAKAEYFALSQSLRDVIPLITLLKARRRTSQHTHKEVNVVFPVHVKTPTFVCKVHEDNQSCITVATSQKFSPQTKHIACRDRSVRHHFCSFIKDRRIKISYCRTTDQKADILTEPLADDLFFKLRYSMLCGW